MKGFEALILWFSLSCSAGQDIRLPPSIVNGPVMNIVYRSDDQVKLECKGEGNPSVRYEWKKNGADLNLNRENIRKGADGTITIQAATSMDEGFYQCYVTNQYGTAVSNTSHLQRAVLEASSWTPVTRQETVRQGDPFHIQATPKKSFPKSTYGWEVATNAYDRSPSSLRPSKRMQIADNGYLYFTYAIPEDDLNGRIYKSTTYNPYLDLKAGGDYTSVTVTRGTMSQIVPRLLYSSPQTAVAVVGGKVSFRCIFGGYPDFTLSWKGPRGNLPAGRTNYDSEKFNTELTLTNITLDDAGNYTCSANNSIGIGQHTFKLLVQATPTFKIYTDGPCNVIATEGSDATFNCKADANPAATITWFQNGEPLDTSDPPERFAFSNDKTRLTISNVCRDCTDRATDLTVIQCNATNTHGYAFRGGYLNVLTAANANDHLRRLGTN